MLGIIINGYLDILYWSFGENTTKKKLQIFVSSTFTDLIEERQAAVEAILKSGNIPAGMELFTAGDKSQLETITRWIDDSDVYCLILGGRYGSIEPTTGNSYTEVEYDYAKSNNKPLFAIVISDKYLEEKVKKDGLDVTEKENPQKYKLFKEKVLNNISEFYDSPKDIKLAIHETLNDFKERYDFSGWIPGAIENKVEELIEENSNLRKEIEELKTQKKSTLKKEIKKENELYQEEFESIYNFFNSKIIKYKIKQEEYELNVNEFLLKYCSRMITGIYNQYGMTEIDSVLFFNVMPQLNLYDLAEIEPVPRVAYRRFYLTNKGKKYSIYLSNKNNT